MSSLNRLVLVLNSCYEQINIIPARRAFTLILKGTAKEEKASAHVIHTATRTMPVPSVIRLLEYRRIPRQNKSVSRRGILLRDRHTCQYCAKQLAAGNLTIDHV